jgi:hypothetical protein
MQNTHAQETAAILAGRSPIMPDDLPAFGSRIVTRQGYVFELIGWYGPAKGTRPEDRERLALGFVTDAPGAVPVLPEGKALFLGYCLESWIARSEPQRFPRFGRWMRESTVSAIVGHPWKEE